MHNHSTFTMRYLEKLDRFTVEERKIGKRIVAGLLEMESVHRKGQHYYESYLQQTLQAEVGVPATDGQMPDV